MDINILINRPYVKGFELRHGVEAFAHKLTAALGLEPITVKWCRVSTAAMSAGGDMLLSAVADDAKIGRATLVRYVGFVVHELLHRKYTNFNCIPCNSALVQRLHNALEDIWIEHRGIDSGVTGNIGAVLGALVDQIAAEALLEVSDWADPAQYPFVLAVYGRRHASVKLPLAIGLGPLFDEALRRLEVSRGTHDNAVIAQWLADQLTRNATEDELRDDLNDDRDEGTPGDSTEGTPCDDGDPGADPGGDQGGDQEGDQGADQGGDQGADQGDQGDGKGDAEGNSDGAAEGDAEGDAKGDGKDGNGDAEGEADGGSDGEGGEGGKRRGDASTPKAHPRRRVNPNGDFREVEPQLDRDPEGVTCQGDLVDREEHLYRGDNPRRDLDINVPARLRFELRRLLDNSGTTAFEQRRKSGSVDVRSLARVATDGRLFQRRHDTDGVDTAVALLLDVSGSMVCELGVACDAAAALCDTLIKADATVSLMTFSSECAIQAPFGSSFKQISTALRRVAPCGGTNDVFAVRTAQDLLLRRPEARKIMFVLTDGEGFPHDARRQVRAATALGITVIGVGIRSQVRHIYGQGVTVMNLSDLGNAMFREIKLAA